jgi:hypothetical protein
MNKSMFFKILISLTLITSGKLSKAEVGVDATQFLTEKSADPSGHTCFDKWEIQSLANYKKTCEEDRDELMIFSGQYKKCMSGEICDELQTNSRIVYVSSVIMALAIGFVVGARSR